MEGFNDDLHRPPKGRFVDVLFTSEQLWLDVTVLARQIAIEVGRNGRRHHLNRAVARKGEGLNIHTLIVGGDCPISAVLKKKTAS